VKHEGANVAKVLLTVVLAMAWITFATTISEGQTPSAPQSNDSISPPLTPSQLEAAHYTVVGIAVDDPFTFLPFIDQRRNALVTQLNKLLLNKPYTTDAVKTQALKLIAQSGLIPAGDNNFEFDIQSLDIEDINRGNHTLKLRCRVLSIAPPYDLGGAFESQLVSQTSPQTVSGISQMHRNFRVIPQVAYNGAFGLIGGGTLNLSPAGKASKFIHDLSVSGQGSGNTRAIVIALSGSTHNRSLLTDTDWYLDYSNNTAPVGVSSIAGAALSAQFNTQTRPFWKDSTFFRSGFFIQGGNEQARPSSAVLPANTILNTGEGSIRLYEGLSQFSNHDALSVSYGIEFGSIGPATRIDWRKHIAEVSADSWWDIGSHHPFELESDLNIGALQIPGQVPLAERFFGGNAEHFFIPNNTWQIHDQPYFRAVPANELSTTSQGLGGDNFWTVNLTLSYPFFVHPLVPQDVTSDPEVQTAINSALGTAQSLEVVYYEYKDPNYAVAAALLPAIQTSLQQIKDHLDTARKASTDPTLDFDDCSDAIGDALQSIKDAQSKNNSGQYGNVTSLTDLTPNDDDLLGVVRQYCGDNLNASLNNQTLANDLTAIATQRTTLLTNLKKIDVADAQKKAAADLALAHKTLNTLFKEVNIVSIAPVAVLDIARLGPAQPQAGGTRLGPGGGFRVELASYVDFTLGYAANVLRQTGEAHGALFFSMGFRDLFR
jgi:hypothetical protein